MTGARPPVAATLALYAVPKIPFGRVVVVICKGGAVTVRVSRAVVVCAGVPASCTRTCTEKVPPGAGVPVISPPTFIVRPAGRPVAENV